MSEFGGGSRKFLYAAVCIGNLVAFSGGINLGWSSPVNAILSNKDKIDENPFGEIITKEQGSWIGSLLALGAVCGPFLAGFAADKFGRKKTLIFCCGIPMLISFLILAFAKTIILYYVARFIAGCAVGGVFTVLPNFLSEIAEDATRGAVCSSMNVFVVSGPLFSYLVGPFIPIMWFCIICAIWPALFVVLFFLFVPDSPYFLIAVNDSDGAAAALKKFRSTSDSGIRKELENIKTNIEEAMRTKGSFTDIFKSRALVKALIISLTLVAFQQLSGVNTILFYSEDIFEAAETSLSAAVSTIIMGAVQVAASFVTPLLVDRKGRKFLFLVSAVGMLLAEVPLGVFFFLKEDKRDVSSILWLPILCLMVYIIMYNFGFGPLPWTVMAEIFPSNIKSPASTATASFCWLLAFIITKFFSTVSEEIGMAGSFWLFSGFCVLAAVFTVTYMIEPKGKSFQEIQEILAK